ncbi:MAG: F0F1 ATP synthase subunit B [Alphaproteobacteria bacterium]|nr:F0F1 ATP synthase subunit B [Alphaproteobacteria bacterium]
MFASPEFWVIVAFVVFIAAVARRAYRESTRRLDERAARIRAELDEAVRLREEAQALLAGYERRQRDAEAEAQAIVHRAEEDARAVAAKAEADLESSIRRRTELAQLKIAQAEAQALRDVRETAVEVATAATRRLIVENLDEQRAGALIDKAIAEAARKLH